MRKGFTVVEVLVAIVVVAILASLALVSYRKWSERRSVENATRRIYSEIEYQRIRAFSQGLRLKVVADDSKLEVIDLDNPPDVKVVKLGAPFSGSITIDRRGLLSSNSIVYTGDLNLHPSVSCVVSNGVRVRMGQTYITPSGARKCR
ncbi:prepilin-type N-terminal cleavage/methylation domain-containing protein [Thermovibrio sp.]